MLRLGITPGVRLEPPALDRLHQRCHVTLLARLLERRVQILVVPLQGAAVGVGGQHGPDRRRRAGRARPDLRLPGMRRSSAALLWVAVSPSISASTHKQQPHHVPGAHVLGRVTKTASSTYVASSGRRSIHVTLPYVNHVDDLTVDQDLAGLQHLGPDFSSPYSRPITWGG